MEPNWEEAVAFVRKELAKLAKLNYNNAHPSFAVRDVLLAAEEKFVLPTYGVEGWAVKNGRNGVSYLNTGDPYERTIYVRTTPFSAKTSLGCWGDVA